MRFQKLGWIGMTAMAVAIQSSTPAWSASSDITVREFSASGEELTFTPAVDDHLVAVLDYSQPESTRKCGNDERPSKSSEPTFVKLTVRADGSYLSTSLMSVLNCSGGAKRKISYSRSTGKLSVPDLARFMERLKILAQGEARELAAVELKAIPTPFEAHIRFSSDARGVLSEKGLQEFVQTGASAKASAQFMQDFIGKGKIN